jgi:hypothetical protein
MNMMGGAGADGSGGMGGGEGGNNNNPGIAGSPSMYGGPQSGGFGTGGPGPVPTLSPTNQSMAGSESTGNKPAPPPVPRPNAPPTAPPTRPPYPSGASNAPNDAASFAPPMPAGFPPFPNNPYGGGYPGYNPNMNNANKRKFEQGRDGGGGGRGGGGSRPPHQFTLPEDERCTVRISGIPTDYSEDVIRAHCKAYGRIVLLQLNINPEFEQIQNDNKVNLPISYVCCLVHMF